MKTPSAPCPLWAALCALCVSLLLAGCGTLTGDIRKAIPEGSWGEVSATVTGKFSSTKVNAVGVVKDGRSLTAKELHIRHSNVWVPLIEIDATGFVPEEKKTKSLAPSLPLLPPKP